MSELFTYLPRERPRNINSIISVKTLNKYNKHTLNSSDKRQIVAQLKCEVHNIQPETETSTHDLGGKKGTHSRCDKGTCMNFYRHLVETILYTKNSSRLKCSPFLLVSCFQLLQKSLPSSRSSSCTSNPGGDYAMGLQ